MEEQIYSNKFVCFAFAESEVILTFHQIHSGEKSLTYYASKYPMHDCGMVIVEGRTVLYYPYFNPLKHMSCSPKIDFINPNLTLADITRAKEEIISYLSFKKRKKSL